MTNRQLLAAYEKQLGVKSSDRKARAAITRTYDNSRRVGKALAKANIEVAAHTYEHELQKGYVGLVNKSRRQVIRHSKATAQDILGERRKTVIGVGTRMTIMGLAGITIALVFSPPIAITAVVVPLFTVIASVIPEFF